MDRKAFILPLRQVDRQATLEALTETDSGPALGLLENSARTILDSISLDRRSRMPVTRGLRPFFLLACLSILLLETLSLIVLNHPTFLYEAPAEPAGSGLRLAEYPGAAPAGAMPEAPGAAGALPDSRLAAIEAAGKTETGEAARIDPEAVKRALEDALAETGTGAAEARSRGTGGQDRSSPDGAGLTQPPAGRRGGKPAPAEIGAGRATGEAGSGSGVTGYEGAGKSGVSSPLVDYRTRLFKMSGEGSEGRRRASGELSAAELKDFERRYFSSFTIQTGLRAREDAYSAFLKKRWATDPYRR